MGFKLSECVCSCTLYTKQMTQKKLVKRHCALEKPYLGLFTFLVFIMQINLDLKCNSKSMVLSWFFMSLFLLLFKH